MPVNSPPRPLIPKGRGGEAKLFCDLTYICIMFVTGLTSRAYSSWMWYCCTGEESGASSWLAKHRRTALLPPEASRFRWPKLLSGNPTAWQESVRRSDEAKGDMNLTTHDLLGRTRSRSGSGGSMSSLPSRMRDPMDTMSLSESGADDGLHGDTVIYVPWRASAQEEHRRNASEPHRRVVDDRRTDVGSTRTPKTEDIRVEAINLFAAYLVSERGIRKTGLDPEADSSLTLLNLKDGSSSKVNVVLDFLKYLSSKSAPLTRKKQQLMMGALRVCFKEQTMDHPSPFEHDLVLTALKTATALTHAEQQAQAIAAVAKQTSAITLPQLMMARPHLAMGSPEEVREGRDWMAALFIVLWFLRTGETTGPSAKDRCHLLKSALVILELAFPDDPARANIILASHEGEELRRVLHAGGVVDRVQITRPSSKTLKAGTAPPPATLHEIRREDGSEAGLVLDDITEYTAGANLQITMSFFAAQHVAEGKDPLTTGVANASAKRIKAIMQLAHSRSGGNPLDKISGKSGRVQEATSASIEGRDGDAWAVGSKTPGRHYVTQGTGSDPPRKKTKKGSAATPYQSSASASVETVQAVQMRTRARSRITQASKVSAAAAAETNAKK